MKLADMPASYDWNLEEAVQFCSMIEVIAPHYGSHVALAGGCLTKRGRRKDVDVMFYTIRQVDEINMEGLKKALTEQLHIKWGKEYGWVHKATYNGKCVDFFFPEAYPASSTNEYIHRS